MTSRSIVLVVDAGINILLGILLLGFSLGLDEVFGVPPSESAFYPNILGGVLLGIGIALLIERARGPGGPVGLGLAGAIAINLSGGLVLLAWLALGEMPLPTRGRAFLWALDLALIAISLTEAALAPWVRSHRKPV